jgi:hypothetical protein
MTSPIAELLLADAPASEEIALFGQLVGHWTFEGSVWSQDEGPSSYQGRWDFAYVLGGRAVQDVLYCAGAEHGTTLRVPRGDGIWDIVWVSAAHRRVASLTAHQDGDRIVVAGRQAGLWLRWTFNDITGRSLVWRGEESADGTNYRLAEEMRLTRA